MLARLNNKIKSNTSNTSVAISQNDAVFAEMNQSMRVAGMNGAVAG